MLLFPSSFPQQRLWFVERLEQAGAAYSMPWALHLAGELDVAALWGAVVRLVERHEALRTTFVEAEGVPLQAVAEHLDVPLPLVDLAAIEPERREPVCRVLLRAESARRFELDRGPLFRVLLVRLAAAEHVLFVDLHHLIADGWSLRVLWQDLALLYRSHLEGVAPALRPLPIQYGDFAEAQRRWLRGEVLEAQLEHWREALAGAPTLLELPSDRPRPRVQTFAGARAGRRLRSASIETLEALSRREGTTLFVVLLAAFGALLHRFTGQRDLLVGAPVANRNRVETEPLIGLFVNTLPLRMRPSGDLRFRDLVGQVRESTLETLARSEVPFEKIVEELSPARSLGHNPVFQVVFALDTEPPAVRALAGVRVCEVEIEPRTVKFDLALAVTCTADGGFHAAIQYRTALFDRWRIERMLDQYECLLAVAAASPAERLAKLPLLTAADVEELARRGRGERLGESALTVPELVAEQARRGPHAVAVVQGAVHLTFRQLDARALQVAAGLARRGVGGEARVGVCVGRSPELVAVWLGTWKAGAAYVSLDPALPVDRLRFMLADAGVDLVLCDASRLDELAAGGRFTCLAVDELWREHPADPDRLPDASPGRLAYVIYTSGSTGRPKGVGIELGALSRLVAWHSAAFGLGAADRATQVAGLGFDASVWETWPCLAAGGTLRLADDRSRGSLEGLRDWLVAHGVTLTFQPTPLAEQLLALEWPQDTPLRWLLTGGDRLRRHPPAGLPFRVSNNYGPTESTVVTTSATLEAGVAGAPSIGRPIADTQVWVLDAEGRPVPFGIPGELYVGGGRLARGYLGRPARTAARFRPDPFAGESGARLYRTGDLVRFRGDGELVFLGRTDHQVKVRGHRVELGEVEAVLAAQPGVAQCAVRLDDGGAEARLVAYVVGDSRPADLDRALRRDLPDAMVPSCFVSLPELPLNASGKVDRDALPPVGSASGRLSGEALRNPVEEIVAQVWEESLGVAKISAGDHYFELGGHSLSAIRMLSRLRRALEVEVPLRTLFEAPVLADFAAAVGRRVLDGTVETLRIDPARAGGEAPLSFAQQRIWFLEQMSPGNTAYNLHTALRLRGSVVPRALERAVAEVESRHEVLRSVVVAPQGQPVQRVLPRSPRPLPIVVLDALPAAVRETEAARLARQDAERPFDLERGPLLRVHLLELAASDWLLLVNMHHIVGDGWSVGVFVRDLGRLYQAALAGEEPRLPPLPVQYADVALWERGEPAKRQIESHVEYWRKQLGGRLQHRQLELDHPRAAVPTYRGKSEVRMLGAELRDALAALGRAEGVTLFMTLLAAFKALLHLRTGARDVVVGTDFANRDRAETEDLIGLFVNQLVLRTDLSGDPTFRELLRRVRGVTLQAYAHQAVPFDRLVEELRPVRDPGSNPLFQVMFILQSAPIAPLRLPGLEAEPVSFPVETSAFDVTVSFTETAAGGLRLACRYRSALFEAATIQRLMTQFERLLASVAAAPDRHLDDLELPTIPVRKQAMLEDTRKASKLDKLLSVRPRAVGPSVDHLLLIGPVAPGQELPLEVRPRVEGVDLVRLAAEQKPWIEERLARHGGLLFRGFGIDSTEKLKAFTDALTPGAMGYGERSSPRTQLQEGVFTSTDHPADQPIVLHNEQSYTLNWPMKILFACLLPARAGGKTPLADSRRVLARLSPETVRAFREKGVMYMRNYGAGIGLSWRVAFQTEDPKEVDEHCRRAGIEVEWRREDRLRTRQTRPAIRRHPRTGEEVWFNHAFFFNFLSLDRGLRESLVAGGAGEQDLPFQTFFGDGSSIPEAVVEEMRAAFTAETVSFPWQKGDLLLVDNMLAAHGRDPFEGPRKIAVAMAEPWESRDEPRSEGRLADAGA